MPPGPGRGVRSWRFAEEFTVWIIGLAVSIVFAYLCHRIAVGKGRGPALWAVLGFFFPIIALVIILLLPPKTPEPSAAPEA